MVAVGIVVLFIGSILLYLIYCCVQFGRGTGGISFMLYGYGIAVLGILLILWGIISKKENPLCY